MNKKIVLSLAIFSILFSFTNIAKADVTEIEAANYLASEGIIVDQSANPSKYNLANPILRQEIAGTINIMSNLPENTTCKNLFSDVKITADNSWACPRIESLLEAGIIAKNPTYRPMGYVTKAEALGFILGALYKTDYEASKDSKLSWEQNAINFAKAQNILREDIGNYTQNATRGFIFKIMYYARHDTKVNLDELREILGDDIFNSLELFN